MKDIWKEYEPNLGFKRINRKKIIITTIVVTVIVLVGIAVGTYCTNEAVRGWIDKFIFRKEVLQDSVATIDLKEGQNANVYAFNKYIGILDQAKFTVYSNSGSKEKELDVQISNPLYSSANRFLAIAEKGGQKFYLITDKDVSWDATVEGNISQVFVNKNGYVAVVITGTLNKTVIKMYNPSGKAMFTQYLSTTRAIDVSISNDNRYLAIAEIDTSGTLIQSNVKVISIEKATTDSTNSVVGNYKSESDRLITNIEYQDKARLVCMYTDGINIIENDKDERLVSSQDKKMTFQSVELTNNVCIVEEKSTDLFTADSVVNIISTDNRTTKEYTINSVAKEIYTKGNIIALNLGAEVEFISTYGMLVKRYVSSQEITNLVVSDNIAGIIYRDKIEIINL